MDTVEISQLLLQSTPTITKARLRYTCSLTSIVVPLILLKHGADVNARQDNSHSHWRHWHWHNTPFIAGQCRIKIWGHLEATRPPVEPDANIGCRERQGQDRISGCVGGRISRSRNAFCRRTVVPNGKWGNLFTVVIVDFSLHVYSTVPACSKLGNQFYRKTFLKFESQYCLHSRLSSCYCIIRVRLKSDIARFAGKYRLLDSGQSPLLIASSDHWTQKQASPDEEHGIPNFRKSQIASARTDVKQCQINILRLPLVRVPCHYYYRFFVQTARIPHHCV